MQFVTRAQWGAVPPKRTLTPLTTKPRGVKTHYEGTQVAVALLGDHNLCANHVRALQASHLANTTEGYSDLAYSAVVCQHGFVFEGRGSQYRCAANGNQELNVAHFAVCAMVGNSGLTEPTEAMLHGIRDAIEWLQRDGGAGPEIRGHRDGYATSCPGGPLYAWVQAGAPRPGTPAPPPPVVPEPPAPALLKPYPGHLMAYAPTRHDADVQAFQQRMRDRGWGRIGAADGYFGQKTLDVVRAFQTEKGLTRDGVIGNQTWAAAFRTDNIT